MKKLLGFLCAVTLVLGVVGVSNALQFTGTPSPSLSPTFGTLIDFDDRATGTLVNFDDYVLYGITSITETEGLGTFALYSGSQSQPNYLGTGFGGERGCDADMGWDGTIRIEFTNLASMVGIGVANSQGGSEYITAYDSSMNSLETYIVPSGINTYTGIDRQGVFDIAYLEITGDFFAIDDLQFNSGAPVPEPSTILLVGTGLLGIIGFSRKRLNKKA